MIIDTKKNLEFFEVIKYLQRFTNTKNIFLVLLLLIISSITEFLSLISITGFLSILTLENSDFSKIPFFKFFINLLGITNPSLSDVSIILAFTIIISAFLKILTYKKSTYLAASIGSKASKACMAAFLNQRFDSFLSSSESEIINITTNYANSVVVMIYNFIFLLTSVISSFALFIGIILIDKNIALFLVFILPISYFLITYRSRKKIAFNGRFIALKTEQHVSIVKDVFGSFRDIILSGSIKDFIKDYYEVDHDIRSSRANSLTLAALPRYILEPLFILLLTFYIIINSRNGNNDSLYLILGTLVFAALKLLPSFQQIFTAYAGIKTHLPSCSKLIKVSIKMNKLKRKIKFNKINNTILNPTSFELRSINYTYPGRKFKCIQDVNFSISKGELIGIFGESGSGKSTFLDIVLSLLKPQEGSFLINNKEFFKQKDIIENWVNFIAHVPQRVYLIDSTIEDNILFGIEKNNENLLKLDYISKLVLVDQMIPNNKNFRNYLVGCNGAKLSGGQRQRIAIARALILGKPILVLDEATSALDQSTEIAIIKNIRKYFEDITIIAVTHSQQFLKLCDKQYLLKQKRLFLNNTESKK